MQEGLTAQEAKKRLKIHGPNLIRPRKKSGIFYLLFSQIKNPLTLLLLFAALLAFFLQDFTDGYIVLAIVSISALLGFYQEKKSSDAIFKLAHMVGIFVDVIRDGEKKTIHLEKVVPGDLVILNAGDMIPADGIIVECKDFFVDEAQLTGESLPVEKTNGTVFMGSHVSSGRAEILIQTTGKNTKFAAIAEHLKIRPPETSFEQGIRQFGYFLMKVTILLIGLIFAFNIFLERPFLESFLFSLALAVGLTPQLLPAIVTVNLSKGARLMAKEKVIVRHLSSIENFGAMNILCTDKTGTITKGKVELSHAIDIYNKQSKEVLFYGYLNALFQTGYSNPLDLALTSLVHLETKDWKKMDEIPYDFVRKRLSVLFHHQGKNVIITKGAVQQILQISNRSLKDFPFIEEYSSQGFRVLAVATKECQKSLMTRDDEKEMTLVGFLILADALKEGIEGVLEEIKEQGVELKIITGDSHLVAKYIADKIHLDHSRLITGEQLSKMSNEALIVQARKCSIFAEIEPNQKERIILALRKSGNVVGFLGDGINDVTAIHAADVGISVDSAVDVAKETADFVLLHKDLSVLKNGIIEGRKTFMNTLKYIFMASSANFGNMFSMAGASLFLSFLPLLPKQILLTNLLTDLPEMTIATDRVDLETIKKPVKWNLPFIRNFMIVFGLISSIFDYCTFGVLLYFLHASELQFRTGWFLESVASAAMIVLVIRTRKRFFQSAPSFLLGFTVLAMVLFTMFIPYTILAIPFAFAPLPLIFYAVIALIVILYIAFVEMAKGWFYKKFPL